MTSEQRTSQIAIVDQSITHYQTLVNEAEAKGLKVILLSGSGDGVDELAQALGSQTDIDALHIFSHGAEGRIVLGDDVLSSDTLAEHSKALEVIKGSLSEEGDILLYGCNVASGDTGDQFIEDLAIVTQSDIAASDDLTGHSDKGGDWELENNFGLIGSKSLGFAFDFSKFNSTLGSLTFTGSDQTFSSGDSYRGYTLTIAADAEAYIKDNAFVIKNNNTADNGRTSVVFTSSSNFTWTGWTIKVVDNGVAQPFFTWGPPGMAFSSDPTAFTYVNLYDMYAGNSSDVGPTSSLTIDFGNNVGTSGVSRLYIQSISLPSGVDPEPPPSSNTAPVFTSSNSFSVNENATNDSSVLLDVQANDGDGGASDANVTYAITGGTGQNLFSLDSDDGEIRLNATGASTLDHETAASYTLIVQADDGEASNNTTTQNITVNINDINESPTIDTNNGLTVNEGAAATIANTRLNEGDPDDSGTGLTYTITTGTLNGSVWIDADDSGTINNAESALGINGTFTQDDIDNNRVKYLHNGSETNSDSFGFSLADGGEDGASALTNQTFSITVTPQNDAPALGGTPADDAALEDVATAIDLSAYHVSDAEGDTLTLTLGVDRGTIASTDGIGTTSGVTIANSGTASMTLEGTAANLNTYLNDTSKITYTTAANDMASTTLTVTPNDGTENGMADTVTINITPANDLPVAGFDTAIDFDGTNDYVAMADNGYSITTSLTMEAWINPDNVSGVQHIMGKWTAIGDVDTNNSSDSYLVGINNGKVGVWLSDDGSNEEAFTSNSSIANNTWTHVALVFNSGTAQIYINGVLDKTYATTTPINSLNQSALDLTLGATHSGNISYYFSGNMDEVRVWDTALSQNQIQTNLYHTLGGDESNLVGYWNMDEGSGTSISDRSENSHTGTLYDGVNFAASDLTLAVSIEEDNTAGVAVQTFGGSDVDNDGNTQTDTLQTIITALPVHGRLFQTTDGSTSNGTEITAIGTAVTHTASKVIYVPDADFNGNDSIAYGVNDGIADSANTVTQSITVTAVNDAPVLDNAQSPALVAIVEDLDAPSGSSTVNATLVSDLIDNGASLSNYTDVENNPVGIAVAAVNSGTLHYTINGGNTWAVLGAVTANSARVLFADANTWVYFEPDDNVDGTVSDALTFKAWDRTGGYTNGQAGVNTTSGTAFSSATDTVSVSITPVNDTPTLNLDADDSSGAGGSDFTTTFSAEGGAVVVADSDAALADVDSGDQIESLTVTLTNRPDGDGVESVSLNATATTAASNAGLAVGYTAATGVLLISGAASPTVYQTIARGVQYNNTDAATDIDTTDRSITFVANDGEADSATATATLSIVTAPVIDLGGDGGSGDLNAGYTEGDGAEHLAAGATITEPDGDNLNQIVIQLTNAQDGASESIRLAGRSDNESVGGILITYNTATHITLSGDESATNYQNLLQELQYTNTSEEPDATDRTITVQGRDVNGNTGGMVTLTLGMTAVNDAPTLTATGGNPTYVEGAVASDLFNTVSASTVETADRFSDMTLTVTNVADGAFEVLSFDGSDLGLTDGNSVTTATNGLDVSVSVTGSTATVTFTGESVTSAQMQTLVDGLTYRHTSDDPTTAGNRVITITELQDNGGTANSGLDTITPNITSTVTITPVNDAPVISNVFGDNSSQIIAGTGASDVTDLNDAIVSNPDSPEYNGGSLVISQTSGSTNGNWGVDGTTVTCEGDGNIAAGEAVAVGGVNIGTVHVTDDGQGGNDLRIDLGATATSARLQTLLQALTYSAPNGLDARNFTLTLNDNDGTGNGGDEDATGSFTLNVTPNPPVITNLDGDSLDYKMGDGAVVIDQGTLSSVTDADSADFNSGTLTVSVSSNQDAAEDQLSADTSDGVSLDGTTAGSNIRVSGIIIGTLGNNIDVGNDFVVNLNANATSARVEELIRNITYQNTDTVNATENTRTVRFVMTDGDGGTSADNEVTITVSQNTDPEITSGTDATAAYGVTENTTSVTTVTATDPDNDTVTFSITGGADQSEFSITNDGILSFQSSPDFENPTDSDTNNTYIVDVTADDSNSGRDVQTITVTVSDINEAPEITSSKTITAREGTREIGTLLANDDDNDPLTWRINGGTDAGRFTISPSSGGLSFVSTPDFERPGDGDGNNQYQVNVQVEDNTGLTDTADLTVTVTNINEAPVITSPGTLSVSESIASGTRILTLTAADDDDELLTLSMGGTDADSFTFDAATGNVSINRSPDHDTQDRYELMFTASDGSLTDTQAFVLQVLDGEDDSDGDGTPDGLEGSGDSDNDGIPDYQDPDDDNDGILSEDENRVPSLGGEDGAVGDGNGDGVLDTEQGSVSSTPFRQTDRISEEPDAPETFVSLIADSDEGKEDADDANQAVIRELQQMDLPEDVPDGMDMPLGMISFSADIQNVGETETFSLYVDGDLNINGYWKQDAAGEWVNLASDAYGGAIVEEGNKLRLDFQITDGGEFDEDGREDGIITDPGAIAYLETDDTCLILFQPDTDQDGIPDTIETDMGTLFDVKDNDVFNNHTLFVHQLYRDYLGREGDEDGVSYWLNHLSSKAISQQGVTQSFFESAEFQYGTAGIIRFYNGLFDRSPSFCEYNRQQSELTQDGGVETVLGNLMSSNEYNQMFGEMSDADVVESVYGNVFNEESTQLDLNTLLNDLSSGDTLPSVLLEMVQSEAAGAAMDKTVAIDLVYLGYLNRSADAQGHEYWTEHYDVYHSESEFMIQALGSSTEYSDLVIG